MRALPLLLITALLAAGCGTTERKGGLGDTLEARTVSAKLIDVDHRRGLVAVEVGLCNQGGQAVISWHFELATEGGERLHPLRPQSTHSPEFRTVRDGCERGWIVYALPNGDSAKALEYRYDDTGSNQAGDHRAEHDHFVWSL